MQSKTRPIAAYTLFFGTLSLVLGGISLTIGSFFARAFLIESMAIPISAAIWGCTLAFPIGTWVAEETGRTQLKLLGAIGLGGVSLLVCTTSVGWVGLWLLRVPSQWIGFAVLTVSIVMMIWGIVNALLPQIITVLCQDGPVPMRIVQLTDIHLDGITPTWWVRRLVDTVATLKPDVIVFTGDLLDISPHHVADQLALLKQLPGRLGKYAVSGNHDFYLGYPIYQAVLNDIGFTLLDNHSVSINGLTLVGVPDPDATRFGFESSNPPALHLLSDTNTPTIFLSHRPDPFPLVANHSKLLQLSGHTHWGQIPPFGLITRLWHQFSRGYRTLNRSAIYIAKGTGVWGPPMRLFGRSEIVVIELTKESSRTS